MATALFSAAEEGKLNAVKALLTRGNLDSKDNTGCTPLALAAKSGHARVVQALIVQKADVCAKNNSGQTVLFLACWHNHEEVARLLIENNANVDAPDARGWTPLIIAAYHEHLNIVQLLVKAGADVTHRDSFGKPAVARTKNTKVKELLRMEKKETEVVPVKQNKRSASASGLPLKSVQVTEEKDTKFRAELERHIQASTLTLACRAADDSLDKIRKSLNSELLRAYEMLHQEVHQSIITEINRIYHSLGEKLIQQVDSSCKEQGLTVPDTLCTIPTLHLNIFPRRGAPKLPVHPPSRIYTKISKLRIGPVPPPHSACTGLSSALLEQVDSHIESLALKLDQVSTEEIQQDISVKVLKMTSAVLQEMNNNLTQLSTQLFQELSGLIESRLQQIHSANSGLPSHQQLKLSLL